MNMTFARELAVLTVRDPAAAARAVLGLGLPARALWTALALLAVLNALLFAVMVAAAPEASAPIFALVTPFWFLIVVGAMLVGAVWSITMVGRWMGGVGQLKEVLALTVWLMSLRIAVLTVSIFLTLVFPVLALLLMLVAFVLGFWIAVNFVDAAHGFGSTGRSVAVLFGAMALTFIVVTLGLSIVAAPFMGSV